MKIKVVGNGIEVVTDTVEAVGMYINNPSFEFDPKFGSYNLSFALAKSDYEGSALEGAFGAVIKSAYEDASKKNPKIKTMIQQASPVIDEVDDNGDPTGRVIIKLKQRAKIEKDNQLIDRKVKIVDSKGNPCEVNATKGSKIRVSFVILPYFAMASKTCGVSKWIRSVQIIDPVIYEGGSDFDAVDDGYVAGAPVAFTSPDDDDAPVKIKAKEMVNGEDEIMDALLDLK